MIRKENKGKFSKKNFNYINNRLDYLRIIERDLRKRNKRYKDKELKEIADCLADIKSDIFYEIKSVMRGGMN